MKTTLNQVAKEIPTLFKAGIVPFLHSSPAIGKSSIAKQIAEQYKLKVIDLRLTECDSTDLNGLPSFENGIAKFIPFDTFPIESTPIPNGYKGWLLLLDEMNSALPSVQASAYKLILDKMVGQYKLHKRVAIIACGNLDTDNAITHTMSSALISRFAHFHIEISHKEWQEWAVKNNIHHTITAFLNFKPECLYTFNPNSTEPYACPRTWEMLSKVLQTSNDPSLILLASLVGDGVAMEYLTFKKHYNELPKVEDIVANPTTYPVSNNISVQWATLSMLVVNLQKNIKGIVTYLKRFPKELHMVAFREIQGRYGQSLMGKEAVLRDWIIELGELL